MSRLRIADVAKETEEVKKELKQTQIALIFTGVWLIALSSFVFFG
jgi:hypothetical protein